MKKYYIITIIMMVVLLGMTAMPSHSDTPLQDAIVADCEEIQSESEDLMAQYLEERLTSKIESGEITEEMISELSSEELLAVVLSE